MVARVKRRLQLWMDMLVCFACNAMSVLLGFLIYDFSIKQLLVLTSINAIQTIVLLCSFETYSLIGKEWKERVVCIFLSTFFSLLLSLIENGILIKSIQVLQIQLMSFALTLLSMGLANCFFYRKEKKGCWPKQHLLVIISSKTDRARLERFERAALFEYDVCYEVIDSNPEVLSEKYLDELVNKCDVLCVFDNTEQTSYERILKKAVSLHKEIYSVPQTFGINCSRGRFVRFDDVMTLYIDKYDLDRMECFFKRAFDLLFASFCIVVFALPMIVIAVAIKLTSAGPILYKQQRLTIHKRKFDIYKFRTMVLNAEEKSGPVFARKHDPRITTVGRFLRTYRLDELPQLFNVIKGDMSIVGPRPERPFFAERFEKEIDNYHDRFAVKAGLTSLSHVYGKYSTCIFDRTCCDLLYIKNYSFLLDLKIILLTTKTLLLKDSAEGVEE